MEDNCNLKHAWTFNLSLSNNLTEKKTQVVAITERESGPQKVIDAHQGTVALATARRDLIGVWLIGTWLMRILLMENWGPGRSTLMEKVVAGGFPFFRDEQNSLIS